MTPWKFEGLRDFDSTDKFDTVQFSALSYCQLFMSWTEKESETERELLCVFDSK